MDTRSTSQKRSDLQKSSDRENILRQAIEVAGEKISAFVMDKYAEEFLYSLCLYFCNDPRFESEKRGSLKKGLLISGNVGTGKTSMVRLFTANIKSPFRAVSCQSIVDLYQQGGLDELSRYIMPAGSVNNWNSGYLFDDLGAEDFPVKHMGNSRNIMAWIIGKRYDNVRNIPFERTIITTNLQPGQISEFYGERIRSRLREMCNNLVLGGGDRRR